MSQQVWNIQPAEVLVVAGSIHTKPFCWSVSAPCLETPCGGCSSPSWGRAALLGLVGPFCSLGGVAVAPIVLGVTGLTRGLCLTPQFSLLITPATGAPQSSWPRPGMAEAAGEGDISWPCSAFPCLCGSLTFMELCYPCRNCCEGGECALDLLLGLGCSHHREHFGHGVSPPALWHRQDWQEAACGHAAPRLLP